MRRVDKSWGWIIGLGMLSCRGGDADGDSDTASETAGETGEPVTVQLLGSVAKGPFVLGSTISVSPVDNSGVATGEMFNTQTIDDLGRFDIEFEAAGFVALEGLGFYYNEVAGQLSNAPLTLRAFYEIAGPGEQSAYVNVVTHLGYARIQELVGQGTSFDDAIGQTEQELLLALTVGPDGFFPGKTGVEMNLLGGDDDANAYLLTVAAVLAQAAQIEAGGPDGPVDASLQELINTISEQMRDLGQIGAGIQDDLRAAQAEVDGDAVMANLALRFDDLGLDEEVPDIHRVLDNDLDGVVNRDDNCRYEVNPDQEDADMDGEGDACEVACGDGLMEAEEECDDGNLEDGDGCNADCTNSGQLIWEDLGAMNLEVARRLAAADDGAVSYSFSNANESGVRLFDSEDGALRWLASTEPDAQWYLALAFDPDDHVLATIGGNPAGMLQRLDAADGGVLDEYPLPGGVVAGLVVDELGNIAFAGYKGVDSWLGVMDPSAVVDWELVEPPMEGGNIGYSVAKLPNDAFAYGVRIWPELQVRAYEAQGAGLWEAPVQDLDGGFWFDVAAGPEGEVYACSTEYLGLQDYKAVLTRIDPDGTLGWVKEIEGEPNALDACTGVAVDSTGHVVWTYWSETEAQDQSLARLEKLDEDGELVWSQTYDAGMNLHHSSHGVAVDAAHNVYWLVSHGQTKVYLAKYSP